MSLGYDQTEQESITIDAGSGWPELSTGAFRRLRRIPAIYEESALADSLNRSVDEVQLQLTGYLQRAIDAGTDKDVPFSLDETLAPNFSEKQKSSYRNAVYARSHADLMGYFSTVNQKASGENKAQDADQRDSILAQSNRSVRLLLGLSRAGVCSL